ncbi:MAG TPA: ABC-2 family transporter protein [Candidatus Eisenbergiella stercoravium]|nr:ABC-2 family transporter protein [Candidatus Eisenbergiella stercoravium]
MLEILPAASWGYLPTKILLGQYSLADQQYLILMQTAWCVILGILKEAVWRAGLKRYSSVGA